MEESLFLASCPICGRSLFKGKKRSYVESGCPKCGEYLLIAFSEHGFQAEVGKPSKPESGDAPKKRLISNK